MFYFCHYNVWPYYPTERKKTNSELCPSPSKLVGITYSSTSSPLEFLDASQATTGNKSGKTYFVSEVYMLSTTRHLTLKDIRQRKSWEEIVSEIGGWLGLFVGASLFTVVEILIHFAMMIKLLWRKRRGRILQPGV